MRIRTQLLLAAAAAAAVVLVVAASLQLVAQRGAASLRAEADSQDIARTVANLLTLTQEYTLFGGERAAVQWRARHAQLAQTVDHALARETPPHPALAEVGQRIADLRPLFERLEDAVGAGGGSELAQRRRDLMVERLVSETQELVDARHRWATAIAERRAAQQRVGDTIVLAASGVLLLLVVALAWLVARRVLAPLTRLQAAAAAIGRGDLALRCDDRADDEIGDTGRAVNAMAGSLLAANAALRVSQERYQLAVDGAEQGIWDWDLDSDTMVLSPRAQRLTGIEAGEPRRPRAAWLAVQVCHPDDEAAVRAAVAAYLGGAGATDGHLELEYRIRHRSGDWRWVRCRGVALRDAGGRAYRMAGSVEDISARKAAEAERLRLEAQLRQAQKLEAIGTLAGGIAHDFNNILSAILGYGEMVQRAAGAGTSTRRHIDAVVDAGQRAKSLVQRILAFSRAGVGERTTVPVRAVVDEALDHVAGTLPPGIGLQRELDAAVGAGVTGDATQIHQVVLNLCTNAVHAMRAGGVLGVTLAPAVLEAPLAVATNTLAAGRYVCLRVADTGSGIEPQVLERIFDPFFTTKEVGVGTGLGLSLVHGIVADLGGGIAVASRVGAGTTFTIYLPWQELAAAAAADEAAPPPGGGETVLVVDDEETLVQLSEEMLADMGYEPVGFVSPAKALASFRAAPQRFDAVLTDDLMPGLGGTELALELRRLRPELPVVLVCGFVDADVTARARAAGIATVLVKPLAAGELARGLAAALHRAAAPVPGGG